MDCILEQTANIKFCVNSGKSAPETFDMIRHVYGNQAMIHARYVEWHARFKSSVTSLDDDKRSGRPSTSSIPENVETIRHKDRRRSIIDITAIVHVSYGTVQAILTSDFNMHRIATEFVPRLLTPDQKLLSAKICPDLHQRALDDPTFMSRVITGDETNQQCSQWKRPTSPRPKKARHVRSATKSMLVVFFDSREVVHREFVRGDQTVNDKSYCNDLVRLREDIRLKRPELRREGN